MRKNITPLRPKFRSAVVVKHSGACDWVGEVVWQNAGDTWKLWKGSSVGSFTHLLWAPAGEHQELTGCIFPHTYCGSSWTRTVRCFINSHCIDQNHLCMLRSGPFARLVNACMWISWFYVESLVPFLLFQRVLPVSTQR